ncbi:hypothetical protein SH668x_002766 [Planctomicrobium sp. SH668]|uniref:hypothetical protein n=1 Tax=Planctomicrobium sp. SH668 TaxID=3448126 RepID=UPI003F5BCA43
MKYMIDEILLQRCVDGELTEQERAELLRALQSQGTLENWKALALSFVEHQVFSKVFSDGSAFEQSISFQLTSPNQVATPTAPGVQTQWFHRRLRPWVSIAASLLLGLGVGYVSNAVLKDGDNLSMPVASHESNPAPPPNSANGFAAAVAPNRYVPISTAHISTAGNEKSESVSVPLFSVADWNAMNQERDVMELPDDVHRVAKERGLRLHRSPQWHRSRLSDGREVWVPVETIKVSREIQ